MTQRIVLATNNAGKVREFNQLLAGSGLEVIPQSEFQIEEIEETGLTFAENALLKARNAAQHTGLPAIADDSGWTHWMAHLASTRHVMPALVPATGRTWKSCWRRWKVSATRTATRVFNA